MLTMQEVAKRAGFSAKTRAKVHAVLEDMNYRPTMLARSFRDARDGTIEQLAMDRGMFVFVTTLGEDPALGEERVERIMRRNISGRVIAPVAGEQSYLANWGSGMPTVFIGWEATHDEGSNVLVDEELHATEAVGHLIGHGHSRIAFIGDDTWP